MQKVIKIVGLGNRVQGEKIPGKPYDFRTVDFIFDDIYVQPQRSGSSVVPWSISSDLVVGVEYMAEIMFHDYRPVLKFIYGKAY